MARMRLRAKLRRRAASRVALAAAETDSEEEAMLAMAVAMSLGGSEEAAAAGAPRSASGGGASGRPSRVAPPAAADAEAEGGDGGGGGGDASQPRSPMAAVFFDLLVSSVAQPRAGRHGGAPFMQLLHRLAMRADAHPAAGGLADLLTLCRSGARRARRKAAARRWWQKPLAPLSRAGEAIAALEVNVLFVIILGLLLARPRAAQAGGAMAGGASRDGAGGGGDAVGGGARGWQRWVHVGRTAGGAQGAAEGGRPAPLLARYPDFLSPRRSGCTSTSRKHPRTRRRRRPVSGSAGVRRPRRSGGAEWPARCQRGAPNARVLSPFFEDDNARHKIPSKSRNSGCS